MRSTQDERYTFLIPAISRLLQRLEGMPEPDLGTKSMLRLPITYGLSKTALLLIAP